MRTEFQNITQADIIEAIQQCTAKLHKDIKPTKILKNSVYCILSAYFLKNKRYVIAQCPTGTGKTIIGFMVFFCIQYLKTKKVRPDEYDTEPTAYFLTSNKALQEQISNDIERFNFRDYLSIIKGVANYECIPATKRMREDENFKLHVIKTQGHSEFAGYQFRSCAGLKSDKIAERFSDCFFQCPYKAAREIAVNSPCSVLNYAYYLNVLRNRINGPEIPNLFNPRMLTICDEAHLVPDIVTNMFNLELKYILPQTIKKFLTDIQKSFGGIGGLSMKTPDEVTLEMDHFYFNKLTSVFGLLGYIKSARAVQSFVKDVFSEGSKLSNDFSTLFGTKYDTIMTALDKLIDSEDIWQDIASNRRDDFFVESESDGFGTYTHTIKDLNESNCIKNNFLSDDGLYLFMSATIGNVDEYATLMGLEPGSYVGFYVDSTFDFSNSPIYLCNAGYLNYSSFNNNINDVIAKTLKLCSDYHPNEKGVIHTATFKINNILRDTLIRMNHPQANRFLFYTNTKEKEEMIELLRNGKEPYILCGPSLYEGIDLPGDMCRFQILVKVPYAQINRYVECKSKRYPFWYTRNCIEKIIQAIGRSNRYKDDWSKIYLLDSSFGKVIYDTTNEIVERLRKFYI